MSLIVPELAGDGAVLISAARLEDPEALLGWAGRTGYLAEQTPLETSCLSRSPAAVALVFPTFRDGRAYSQARLRERYGQ